jgi:glyoxylase-like metal-dependent hydrolase (beta-lactamase superfamily II)
VRHEPESKSGRYELQLFFDILRVDEHAHAKVLVGHGTLQRGAITASARIEDPVLISQSGDARATVCARRAPALDDHCFKRHHTPAIERRGKGYTMPFAREVAAYAQRLGKPIARLYVTHYHPDHLLGACEFAAPLYTLAAVSGKIAAAGDRVASEEHEKHPEDIPVHARQPDYEVREGLEIMDGVRIEHLRVQAAETEDALVIGLPDVRAVIVQDLVYNRVHLFMGERDFDGWRSALVTYRELPYDLVLPGHGVPGGRELYDEMITYLDFGKDALASSTSAGEFRQKMLDRFPDYGGVKVLDHQLRFLFR